jgi:hypothetical protein
MVEVYKGTPITISTSQTEKKTWTSRAEYQIPGQADVQLEPPAAEYATEDDARQAALQAAVESLDRMRVTKGKN